MIPILTREAIVAGVRFWLEHRPWLRMRVAIRDRVNKRRARLGKPPLPPFEKENAPMLPLILELTGSILRIGLPTATAFLTGLGIHLDAALPAWLQVTIAIAVYLVMQLWSIVRKIRDKPRATGTPPQ